jgi:hypothetical protein
VFGGIAFLALAASASFQAESDSFALELAPVSR